MLEGPASRNALAASPISERGLGWLRARGEGAAQVTPVELFFDLVYVLAVTQLTRHLLDHLSLAGAGQTLLLLLAVWSAWVYTAWITNWFDPNTMPVRLMLVGAMLVSLILSASLPGASTATDPGRLARSAYSYFHIPMVAGIIAAAAADELTIAHPTDAATVATTAVILGGPALYLAGNALFKWALWEHVPLSRLVAICALAALVPLARVSSALIVSVAATLVVVALVLWDIRAERVRLSSAELGPDRVRTPPVNIPSRPRLGR